MSALPFYNPKNKTMQARPVQHRGNLIWWALLILVVIGAHELPQQFDRQPPLANQNTLPVASENEAFIALVYGKISTLQTLALSASAFESQLEGLKRAGYKTVKLAQIDQWQKLSGETLPAKPVLLTFEEAHRETLEIADAMLAKYGMNGVVYVDVEQIEQANIHLVSWHRLEQLAKNGRWEVGISVCPGGNNDLLNGSSEWAVNTLKARRALLEKHLHVPILSADCSRSWQSETSHLSTVWHQILQSADLPTGFIVAPLAANYRSDSLADLRRIRVSRQWDAHQMISVVDNLLPRRKQFSEDFNAPDSELAWVVDRGDLSLTKQGLRLTNSAGENGALMMLGGTDKWQSAEAEITLASPPKGQFWLSLRHSSAQPSIRLGLVEGQVMLEMPDGNGGYHLLASHTAPTANVTLKLRVIGHRAMGFLNGEPLLERPANISKNAKEGALAIAVWDKQPTDDAIPSGQAEVRISQMKAIPLYTQALVTPATLNANEWQTLSERAETLSAISPSYFAWLYGKPKQLEESAMTMEIFANYHHLDFLPALFIEGNTPVSDSANFTEQALQWAMNPAYDGLNVVLNSANDNGLWQPLLDSLNKRMRLIGKTLIVTTLDDQARLSETGSTSRLLPVAAPPQLLTHQPEILHSL